MSMNFKITRIVDPDAIAAARLPWCEWCGRQRPVHIHHVKSKGSGGHDVAANLASLCWECHREVHNANIPRLDLRTMIDERERLRSWSCPCGGTRLRWQRDHFICHLCHQNAQ